MGENFKAFSSLLHFFYQDQGHLKALSSVFLKNAKSLDKLFKTIFHFPSCFEMLKFLLTSSQRKPSQKDFELKAFSNMFKECFICLISMNEILLQKSYETFTDSEWKNVNPFISEHEILKLRFSLFKYRNNVLTKNQWNWDQDQLLKICINKFNSSSPGFPPKEQLKISWTTVSKEFNKEIQLLCLYKTEKQCKERWYNHLCPYLKKEKWSLEEDMELLAESLKTPKQWAQIAKKLVTRNCHQIKNRFICLMSKEMNYTRERIRDLINQNLLSGPISLVLEKISQKCYDQKQQEETRSMKEEETCDDFHSQEGQNFEKFINFDQESPILSYFD